MNRSIVITNSEQPMEEPSPAPAPTPEPEIVHAEPVSNITDKPIHIIDCNYIREESGKISLKIKNVNEDITYIRIIRRTDTDFSETYARFFQNDFNKFYEILNSALNNETDQLRTGIENVDENSIKLTLVYNGLLPFELSILLTKEEDRFDKMEKHIERLISENIYLKEQNKSILQMLQKKTEDYYWLVIDRACLDPHNLRDDKFPYSGESVSEEDMKLRMIDNNYWLCYKTESNKMYYGTNMMWKYNIQNLKPVPENITEKSQFYIRIPKEDFKNNKQGLGILNDKEPNQNKLFHGQEKGKRNRREYESYYENTFLIRPLSKQNLDWSVRWRGPKPPNDNIMIPPSLYCTNCKIKGPPSHLDGDGWSDHGCILYECMGHDIELI